MGWGTFDWRAFLALAHTAAFADVPLSGEGRRVFVAKEGDEEDEMRVHIECALSAAASTFPSPCSAELGGGAACASPPREISFANSYPCQFCPPLNPEFPCGVRTTESLSWGLGYGFQQRMA